MTKKSSVNKKNVHPDLSQTDVIPETAIETETAEVTDETETVGSGGEEGAAVTTTTTTEPILYVDSEIKKALFDLCIRPEFLEGGRWAGKSQVNLAKAWIDVKVVVDPTKAGRTFDAQKTNWNVNDSNWVNKDPVYARLAKAAAEANGGVSIPKKALVGQLEDLKKTFALKVAA